MIFELGGLDITWTVVGAFLFGVGLGLVLDSWVLPRVVDLSSFLYRFAGWMARGRRGW